MGENHNDRTFAYRLAEFVLYSIFVFGDVHFLWEDHRSLSLLIALAGFWCLLVIDRGFSRRSIAVLLSAAMAVALIFYFIGPKPEPTIGWLQASNQPVPHNGCDVQPPGRKIPEGNLLIFGSEGLVSTKPSAPLVVRLGLCPITVKPGPNGVTISAEIYSDRGELLGKIEDNRYSISHDLKIEKSGDLSALSVHDAKGTELLYLRYLNPKTMRLRGEFWCPKPILQTLRVTDWSTIGMNAEFIGGCIEDQAVQYGEERWPPDMGPPAPKKR